MAVYVDDARIPARVGRIRGRWSHLTADSKDELHTFAARLGLRRAWFQDKDRGLWHYDVTESVRARAVAMGAVEMAWRDMSVWHRPGREGRPGCRRSAGPPETGDGPRRPGAAPEGS
jgi:hypothetical protein